LFHKLRAPAVSRGKINRNSKISSNGNRKNSRKRKSNNKSSRNRRRNRKGNNNRMAIVHVAFKSSELVTVSIIGS
jgi:hypothetical protein